MHDRDINPGLLKAERPALDGRHKSDVDSVPHEQSMNYNL